ncbi:hypothetical protein [Haloferula sp. A504]|uniref:hypothetical protein n=1 Tax=Haloferula sp. A504 TaxID=3373601 RepID=UPI0031C45C59|nr:hypothetical protein [Verrucomicrobiaceae bacterium E54]
MPGFLGVIACCAAANEVHRFDADGRHLPAGWPEPQPRIVVLAEEPLRLQFEGVPADWKPVVHLHRVTGTRRVPLAGGEAEGASWTWTPPAARGPAHYEVRFGGEPERVVHIEARDPSWLKATLGMLRNQVDWNAVGLTADERRALTDHGLRIGGSSGRDMGVTASLEMTPRQGDAARRRVVWDERHPNLVVWRPGPAAGDLEVRAPRWWISAAALATDEGLIRMLDLFTEPPYNP